MGCIKNCLEKIKRYLTGEKEEAPGPRPTIRIGERHEAGPPQPPPSASEDAPRITVRAVHRNSSAADEAAPQAEEDIVNQELGKGIIVNKRRKPERCPICATRGRVVANTSGNGRWMCEECGSTFN